MNIYVFKSCFSKAELEGMKASAKVMSTCFTCFTAISDFVHVTMFGSLLNRLVQTDNVTEQATPDTI